ncbi:tetraacyldisaccharide 4'-kinase [Fibrobacterales bacterium]|nr:tetraacyldisaccharide 4'-kinase [Fibrobacterales bacterium]
MIDKKTRLSAPRRPTPLPTPFIGIGSLLAGGAGKTPYTAFLVKQFTEQGLKVAIICKNTGDENLWFAKKGFSVFTTNFFKNRLQIYNSIKNDFDVILTDDGLEDGRLSNVLWIVLTWGEKAEKISDLIPNGNCRSLWKDHGAGGRISCIKRCAVQGDGNENQASIIFSTAEPKNFLGCLLKENSKIIALAGIARPERFFNSLSKKYNVIKKITLPDHCKNISSKVELALKDDLPIAITEKDSIKLPTHILQNKNLFVAELKIEIASQSPQ